MIKASKKINCFFGDIISGAKVIILGEGFKNKVHIIQLFNNWRGLHAFNLLHFFGNFTMSLIIYINVSGCSTPIEYRGPQ